MARLNKIAISLCALLFTSISLTPLAHASGHTHASATPKAHPAKGTTAERKKKAASSKSKTTAKTPSKKTSTASRSNSTASRQTASATKKCVLRKGYKKLCAQLDKVDSRKQNGNRKRAEKVRSA
ncbi:lipoprotein [Klebsiella michiganensis]|nr:lipoprotein [Klebsiella michiganensis]